VNVDALAGFLDRRQRAGDDGKTFLIGYRASVACFAVAAGLRNAQDRQRFVRFARYLLHHRFGCDGHALLMPAERAGRPVYAVEVCTPDAASVRLIDHALAWHESGLDPGLIGELREHDEPLPGLLRRELDRLYEAVRVEP
jgi:hypothetical protein